MLYCAQNKSIIALQLSIQNYIYKFNGGGYVEGSTEAPGFLQWRLIEEGEGDWIGRVRLMESGGE